MLFAKTFFLSLLLFGVQRCSAKVSCASCPNIQVDLTTDAELNTEGCTIEEDELCSLILRIDYTFTNESFALISGTKESMLVLTNGEAMVNEVASIWFDQVRVQRMANIVCFYGASCGLDLLKQIYKDQFRPFDYAAIHKSLADLLYSPTAVSADLQCADPTGNTVPCADGFCRSISDGNGFVTYSNCVKKTPVATPFGLTVSRSTMNDFGGDQSSLIFTCNKPLCNSKQTTEQVRQLLANAGIIPAPTGTTTTPKNAAKSATWNEQQTLVAVVLAMISMFEFVQF